MLYNKKKFLRLGIRVSWLLCVSSVCIVLVWCIGSGFSFFSSFKTNVASVLYTSIFMYVCVFISWNYECGSGR